MAKFLRTQGVKKTQGNSIKRDRTPRDIQSIHHGFHMTYLSRIKHGILSLFVIGLAVWTRQKFDHASKSDAESYKPLSLEDYLSTYICRHPKGYCHPSLVPVSERRTHKVETNDILPNSEILVLPRERIITDLDAMRSPWIQAELFGAVHTSTGNYLDAGAYLAAFLAHRINLSKAGLRDPMVPYFESLPTYNQLLVIHPTLWSDSHLQKILKGSSALKLILAIKTMIKSEYESFSNRSNLFASSVSVSDYSTARINVLARSFGTGSVSYLVDLKSPQVLEELEYYRSATGVELKKGCRALTPILDMWDHHPRAATRWLYSQKRAAFIVQTQDNNGIAVGSDVWVSYGTYTESHLYAKFGFTNRDGSSWTEASISTYHEPLDVGLGFQWNGLPFESNLRNESITRDTKLYSAMAKYIDYDDGYDVCIDIGIASQASRLRSLKLQHMIKIAHSYHNWNFKFGPREPSALPKKNSLEESSTFMLPSFNPKKIKFDGKRIMSTCRLITLTDKDFDGRAYEILWQKLQDGSASEWLIERLDEESEFRSLGCLARLAMARLKMYPTTAEQDIAHLTDAFDLLSTYERQAIAVRIGEKQTLDLLIKIALDGIYQKRQILMQQGRYDSRLESRSRPCRF